MSSKMSRNRDIRGFFGKPTSSSSSLPKPSTSSQPVRDLQPSPIISPRTPTKLSPKPRDRSDEIKGSDDEDGDSDDSLESISALMRPKKGPAPYKRDSDLATPRPKRIASSSASLLKSPLTIQTRHKYDLKTLINHARQSDRADESARRADELINQSDDDYDEGDEILREAQNDRKLLQKTAKDLLDNDDEDAKGDKLMRAMSRTKVDGSRRAHYFFELEPVVKPLRKPFPQKKAKGPWTCLAGSRGRNQVMISGLPHTIIARGNRSLPDELFLWILDEVCVEKNAQLRVQYCNLVTLCPDSIARLVTDARLYSMLERLGAPKKSLSQAHGKAQSYPKAEDPYPRKDWAGLATFLELLERMAPNLSTPNAIGAIRLLLRMALDPIVSSLVRSEHAASMAALAGTLPKQGSSQWNEACEEISLYLCEIVDGQAFQAIPISHMPKTTAKLQDLSRRMAAVVLFENPQMSRQPVDETLTLDEVMDRLDYDDFRVGQSTNFDTLRALATLLDIVIGGGGFIMRQYQTGKYTPRQQQQSQSNQPEKSQTGAELSAAEQKQAKREREKEAAARAAAADASIDALTFQLKVIHDKIQDSTVLARKLTKASIDLVAKRLTYAVRSRPPPKTSIFDPEPGEKEDAYIPRQKNFMKNWASKKAEWNGAAASTAGGDGKIGEE
ncbi:hypothetical protein GGR54DRAFT_297953 [Hypoxylon sp. NC1633]|nr:hypothetical protein GGR54DRAFT_297953 [Hypoxylon sp. NC1633]